jgi:hypothetical protein
MARYVRVRNEILRPSINQSLIAAHPFCTKTAEQGIASSVNTLWQL